MDNPTLGEEMDFSKLKIVYKALKVREKQCQYYPWVSASGSYQVGLCQSTILLMSLINYSYVIFSYEQNPFDNFISNDPLHWSYILFIS